MSFKVAKAKEGIKMAAFCSYQLQPPVDLVDASDLFKIHQVLKQMQSEVNRLFTKHKKGRINCKTKDYKICISKSEDSLIVKVKCIETGRILLSQRLKVGGCIVI